jgi:hypothetical protein
MSLNGKFSSGKASSFNKTSPFKNFQLATVIKVGKVPVSKDDKGAANRDRRFNADTHAIRVRIVGSKYDNGLTDFELPNCFPFLPRHINFVPKVGEVVMVMVMGEDEKFGDRWYTGPVISSDDKLNKDTIDGTAMSNLANGITQSSSEISFNPLANGVYENPQNVVIEGRDNTDLIQRSGEVLIRAGKFVSNNPLLFNATNPAYFQLKHNVIVKGDLSPTLINETEYGSVSNIVANKINLLTYGTPTRNNETFNLTNVNENTKVADYITNDELNKIINTAHPAVFGDTLVEYLKLLREALTQHVHNGNGNEPTDRTDRGTLALNDFITKAKELEKKMLSDNIRIN